MRVTRSSLDLDVVRQAAASFTVQGTGLLLSFAAQVAVARMLGVAEYGMFVAVLAWLNASVVVARQGCDTAVLRFGAQYAAAQDWVRFTGLVRFGTRRAVLAGAVVAVLMFAAISSSGNERTPRLICVAALAALALPVFAASGIRQSALLSAGRVVRSLMPESVVRPISFTAGTALAVSVGYGSACAAMAANTLAICLAFLVGAWWLAHQIPSPSGSAAGAEDFAKWSQTARGLLLFNGTYAVLAQVDVIVLGLLAPSAEAGAYYAARQLTTLALFGMIATQMAAAPRLAALHAEGRRAELQRVVSLTALGGLLFAGGVGAALIVAGGPLLGVFGPGFEVAQPALYVLVAAQVVNALAGPAGILASMSGHQMVAVRAYAGGILVTVGASAGLYPRFGLVAPALGVLAGTIAWTSILRWFVGKRLGVATHLRWRDLRSPGRHPAKQSSAESGPR